MNRQRGWRIIVATVALFFAVVYGTSSSAQAEIGGGASAYPSDLASQSPCELEGSAVPESCLDWSLAATPATPPVAATLPDPQPYGPPAPENMLPSKVSLGRQVGAVKWEVAAVLGYMTVTQFIVTRETRSFHFQDEGWFGKDTKALGLDKLAHAYNAYIIADILNHRIQKRTGAGTSGAVTAAALAFALQFYSELYDAHKVVSGFSAQDVLFNGIGAGFSALRNSVPGLKDKLDFRLMIVPNSDVYTFKGKRHYAQQRYLFALTPAGFDRFRDSPLRFLELHAGYYAKDFTLQAERLGKEPKHKPFVGVGINLKELFFREPRSRPARWAGSALDYLQVPYTAVHVSP